MHPHLIRKNPFTYLKKEETQKERKQQAESIQIIKMTHRRPSNPINIIICTLIVMITTTTTTVVDGFEFQHDYDEKKCQERADQCVTYHNMWYECPITCSKHYELEGQMAEERNDPEQLFQLHVTKYNGGDASKTSTVSLEDNEGYLTLFAVLPLLPGMAQYYYDAIDHISKVYKYTLVPIILPIIVPTDEDSDQQKHTKGLPNLKPLNDSKCVLLQPEKDAQTNSVLRYLLSRTPVAGNSQLQFTADRPTIFLVSHTGMYIERIVAPTMELMELRIKVHELSMSETDL
jgi:hypothetical protein